MRIRRGPPAAIFFYLQHAHAVHPIQAGVNSRSGDGRPRSLSTSTPTRPRSPVSAFATPRVTANAIEELGTKGYAVVPNFLSPDLVSALNRDISNLRSKSAFSVARIGQDATNKLNTEIRVAETCFIGRSKLSHIPDTSREQLYDALESVRDDLTANSNLDEHQNGDLIKAAPALDSGLSELLYAFYPSGGFYRRHRDAIAGSASVLRCYSLLLYLNEDWKEEDGGKLRMHFDGGGDFSPDGVDPNFVDIEPHGGTLVLFKSDKIPHEVLDTHAVRSAVVGWYNRGVTSSDLNELAGEGDMRRAGMLMVAFTLVAGGLFSIFAG